MISFCPLCKNCLYPDRQTDRQTSIFSYCNYKHSKNFKKEKNSRFKANMLLKLIYLPYEEAVKGREVFESNDYPDKTTAVRVSVYQYIVYRKD